MRPFIATKPVFNSMIAIIALLILVAATYLDYVIQDRHKNALLAETQQHLSILLNNLVTNLQVQSFFTKLINDFTHHTI